MPSSSSEDDSSLQKKHSKKESKSREEKHSKTEKKKRDEEYEDTADRDRRSSDRKHTKKAKSKRKHRDRDSDSESPEAKKRSTLSPEVKLELHNRPKKEKSMTSEEMKRHHDKPEKVRNTSTGSPESGGRQKFPDRHYDDNKKRSPQASYNRSSRDFSNNRERFDKRNEARQFGPPSDRPRDRAGTPPWKRRAQEERKDANRPVWATSRVIEHAEQIQKRKLLWQRPAAPTTSADDDAAQSSKAPAPSSGSTNWTSMLAATGSDEKSVDKFKRLMGIRDEGGATSSDAVEAERNRQQALYRDLDEQYNIARSVTHTGRGQGLGFASKYL